jgi:hypothetical protein
MGSEQATVWVLLPFFSAVVLAAVLGFWRDNRHGKRDVLLTGDVERANATVDCYSHVQDSLSG